MDDRLLSAIQAGRPTRSLGIAGIVLFVITTILSAGLLFALEPMFTRMVLPRFGGSASVWSVAIVFFQGTLLIGYAYAHLLARLASVRLVPWVHVVVLATGLLFLPPSPSLSFASGGSESLDLLLVFAVSVGAPFAALSASAPLLQACFLRSGLPGAGNPYPLYAASNAGSLGALLAYPLVLEPWLTLGWQSWLWAAGYAGMFGLMGIIALVMLRAPQVSGAQPERLSRPAGASLLRWAGLGLVPSAGLVAVTAHLSTDIAAAPFLWVAPLALYLATFVIAFGSSGAVWRGPVALALPPVLILLAVALIFEVRTTPVIDVLLHLGGFFLLSLHCHGRLAELRPAPRDLTWFYLAMSAGGVAGGILSALAAPVMFSFVAEYPIVLALAALTLLRAGLPLAAAILILLTFTRVMPLDVRQRETFRSFHGVHTIETTSDGRFRTLRHGIEVHGAQRLVDDAGHPVRGKPVPLTYYNDESPISEAIDAVRAKGGGKPVRIGVVGLGAGSIACLAEPADQVDFYEIDPLVIWIARDSGRFSFLSACGPKPETIEGDARLTLAAQRRTYDILILDAFSSDSIPVHLLTREALAGYMARLAPEGQLLLHISNNHLRLTDVVASTARSLGLAVRINDEDQDEDAPAMTVQPTVAVVARKPEHFGPLQENDDWQAPEGALPRPWTDDYANLFGAFLAKLRER